MKHTELPIRDHLMKLKPLELHDDLVPVTFPVTFPHYHSFVRTLMDEEMIDPFMSKYAEKIANTMLALHMEECKNQGKHDDDDVLRAVGVSQDDLDKLSKEQKVLLRESLVTPKRMSPLKMTKEKRAEMIFDFYLHDQAAFYFSSLAGHTFETETELREAMEEDHCLHVLLWFVEVAQSLFIRVKEVDGKKEGLNCRRLRVDSDIDGPDAMLKIMQDGMGEMAEMMEEFDPYSDPITPELSLTSQDLERRGSLHPKPLMMQAALLSAMLQTDYDLVTQQAK